MKILSMYLTNLELKSVNCVQLLSIYYLHEHTETLPSNKEMECKYLKQLSI